MKIYQLTSQVLTMRTQNKENQYYLFWIVAMIAFIAPQVVTAFAYHKLADMLTKPVQVEIVETSRMNIDL